MRWWLFAVVLAVSGAARADNDPAGATAKAKEAEAQAKAQNYAAAAASFRAAHRLDPRPEFLCNVGVAYQRAKDWPKAQIYLGECLTRGQALDGKFIQLVRTALGSVEDKLRAEKFTPVDVVLVPTNAAFTVSGYDADEVFVGARVIWLPFGTHTITATLEGYTSATRTVEATKRTQQQVRVELTRAVAVAPPTGETGARLPDPPAITTREVRPSKLPPLATSVLAVGFVVGGVLMFGKATDLADQAGEEDDLTKYNALKDRLYRWQYGSWAMFAGAGISAVASGLLWYRVAKGPRLEVLPTDGGGSVALSGTW